LRALIPEERRSRPYELLATSGAARLGRLHTAHGPVELPAFMPVGTAGAVKAADPDSVAALGSRLLVCNTYHLYLRPGHALVERLGGLHRFMGWQGAILTDSGGYQAFSMAQIRRLDDQGVRFRSHLDGAYHLLTPELSLEVQRSLGSDIVMMLDECSPYPASEAQTQAAVRRTTAWARRCLEAFRQSDDGSQMLFPILQGGVYPELRRQSLDELGGLELPAGLAIGGLSVGESSGLMLEVLDQLMPQMPTERVRYLMGVGRPWELLEAVARGVDLFDCVLPTRVARNGLAFTSHGRVTIKNARYRDDEGPLDRECACSTCSRFSRAYLRHLHSSGEILSAMLLTHHNLSFYLRLMDRIRQAIKEGCFPQLHRELAPILHEPASRPARPMPAGHGSQQAEGPAGCGELAPPPAAEGSGP
jgi:queuine tRNA-ribosyltransferase